MNTQNAEQGSKEEACPALPCPASVKQQSRGRKEKARERPEFSRPNADMALTQACPAQHREPQQNNKQTDSTVNPQQK